MKVRDAIDIISRDGWYQVKQVGSHRQFKHPVKPGKVTVAGKASADLAPGTLASIFRQAQIEREG
jgi:predicted RNA binding protein YcfA (HicA-like mRNA interferase family)